MTWRGVAGGDLSSSRALSSGGIFVIFSRPAIGREDLWSNLLDKGSIIQLKNGQGIFGQVYINGQGIFGQVYIHGQGIFGQVYIYGQGIFGQVYINGQGIFGLGFSYFNRSHINLFELCCS